VSALPHARAPHATGNQEWEQGRRRPESAVRAFLTVIDRNPEAVEKALMDKP
jgi:putative transcriptional regulator